MRALSFYAFLALGLLLDGAQIFRLVLLCAALHECGHAAVYIGCARRLPRLCFGAGGVRLERTAQLSRAAQAAVLCAGPGANFALSAALLLRAQCRASYTLYFLAAASICVGAYNLLPVGVLDGAQLLCLWLPARLLPPLWRLQRVFLLLLCTGAPLCAALLPLGRTAKIALLAAPAYLFVQEVLCER